MKSITILDYTETQDWNVDRQILTTDDFWIKSDTGNLPEFALNTRAHLTAHGCQYNIAKFDQIDKSKPWFIFTAIKFPFTTNFYDKKQWEAKDLFSSFPPQILDELVNGNAYLMLSFEQEAYTTSFLRLFYALYNNNPLVAPHKLIHITTAYNMHTVYDEYCRENNIQEKINIWFSVHSLLGPIGFHVKAGFFDLTPSVREKKYINFNRMPKSHRVSFTSLLAEYDLLDSGYVSLGVPELFESSDNLLQYVNDTLPKTYNWSVDGECYRSVQSGASKLVTRLPLTIDTDNFVYGPAFGYDGRLTEFYDKSYFSIVSNTYCLLQDEIAITLNEKEYKTMLYKQPFLLVARPGTLAMLRDLGFKTFESWFDESYDSEVDDQARLLKLVKEVDRLCKLDNSEWDRMIEEMQPILEYNYSRLVDSVGDIIFTTDFKQILNYAE